MKMQGAEIFFNHSEGFSRWPPKEGVLMLMFPCQIAGLQINLHVQKIFHYEPTKCTTTAVVYFYSCSLWFKNVLGKKSALMYPKTSCIIFRKEQQCDLCQHYPHA